MSDRVVDLFFGLLSRAQQDHFPDLFFRGHRSGNPLVLALPDQPCRQLRLRLRDQCLHLERLELYGGIDPPTQDLTQQARLTTSSTYPGTEAMLAGREIFSDQPRPFGIHTLAQPGEWLCVQLSEVQPLGMVRVHNRDDEWAFRAWSLVMEISTDGVAWTVVYDHSARLAEWVALIRKSASHTEGTPDESRLLRHCGEILEALAAGKYDEARAILDARELAPWRVAIRRGFNTYLLQHYQRSWSGHGITRPFRFWTDAQKSTYLARALELLADLRDLTPAVCFGFGFVLAFVRDGQMIPHDDDLDLIVAFDRKATPTLSAGLAAVETYLRSRGYRVEGDHFNHRWVYKPGWNAVDVFVGLQEDESIAWFPSARTGLLPEDVFPALDADFHGHRCPIPRNPIRYLERTYGAQWRRPDSDFMHPWDRGQYADIA